MYTNEQCERCGTGQTLKYAHKRTMREMSDLEVCAQLTNAYATSQTLKYVHYKIIIYSVRVRAGTPARTCGRSQTLMYVHNLRVGHRSDVAVRAQSLQLFLHLLQACLRILLRWIDLSHLLRAYLKNILICLIDLLAFCCGHVFFCTSVVNAFVVVLSHFDSFD